MEYRALTLRVLIVTALATAALSGPPAVSAADSAFAAVDSGSHKQARAENRALGHAVRQSLTRTKGLDSSRINVLARGGTVTLTGSAPDQSQIDVATRAAENVAGVSRVDNRLTIDEAGN